MSEEIVEKDHPGDGGRAGVLAALGLAAIILLGAFLRFYQLGASGFGNEYYAAAVKSMLTSWHNFFFVSFEPGGSVSVDKPPLGFWIESLSAYFWGVNGFGLAFPNALAGTLSIPILYGMVKRPFGWHAGLFAAFVLAVVPITIAAERNNTIDGMLVFVLLLSAWAVWRAVESGKLRFLILGALLIGLGFNIKMLQAYMVLPALIGLYFLGARHSWKKRVGHLIAAAGLMLVVSISWAWVVDLVPAESRPFVGSSTDNTVMELIVGHNGVRRLLGGAGPGGPQNGGHPGGGPPGGAPMRLNNPPGGPNEVGTAGILRLFTQPLAAQASWLLPLALIGAGLTIAVQGRPRKWTRQHLALVLWAGWLVPVGLYFTFTTGLWHTYYLTMLGPGLAGLCGAAVWALIRLGAFSSRIGWLAAVVSSALTVGFEVFVLATYPAYFLLGSGLMGVCWVLGAGLFWVGPRKISFLFLLLSMLVGPLLWSGLTTFNSQPDVNLPKAGPEIAQQRQAGAGDSAFAIQQKVLEYLLANTAPDAYLGATLDSHGAAFFILATGRPFLTFGGFNGGDTVVTVAQLQKMVADGKLRYVLDNNNLIRKPEINNWVFQNCKAVKIPGVQAQSHNNGGPRDQGFSGLYDCAN